MKNIIKWVALAGVAMSVPALAHHSYSAFDRTKTLTLRGTVAELDWANPHVYIVLMASPPKGGKPIRWMIEGNPPGHMARLGWKKNAAKVGDVIQVVINPLRDGQPGGHYLSADLPNGVKALSAADARAK